MAKKYSKWGLTNNFNESVLGLGRHRIDLAHVPALVLLLDIVDMQEPGAMLVVLIVSNTNPRITGYHMVVHGENGRLLEMHPRHLKTEKNQNYLNLFAPHMYICISLHQGICVKI